MKKIYYLKIIPVIITIFLVVLFIRQIASGGENFILSFIENYRYFSVALFSILSGFIIAIPIPPGTWINYYESAGLDYFTVLLIITVGVTVADAMSSLFGSFIKDVIEDKYPKVTNFFKRIKEKSRNIPLLLIFFWASFVPLPNEFFVYPLTILGYKIRYILGLLLLGNFVFAFYSTKIVQYITTIL